jgi:multicomponent Na+:H+ antiporter subunit G
LWTDVVLVVEYVAIVLGVFFMFVASLGVLRLKDFYMRIHAPTKAATLGLIFLLIAVAFVVSEPALVTKALLAIVFIAVTAPAGAHLLARAAYRNGVPYSADTRPDQYRAVAQAHARNPSRVPTPAADVRDDDGAGTQTHAANTPVRGG